MKVRKGGSLFPKEKKNIWTEKVWPEAIFLFFSFGGGRRNES